MAEDVEQLITLTADIVSAHVSNNTVAVSDMANLISAVHGALAALSDAASASREVPLIPAVPIRASVKPDYIVCLEDGKKLKMLKRHLNSAFGMTPEEYRKKWGLPDSYPMAAPNYVKFRAELARKIGLGRKPGTKLRRM